MNLIDQIRSGDISLAMIARKDKTHNVCLAGVNVDGNQLEHVPKELRTELMCTAACYNKGRAVRFVPEIILRESNLVSVAIKKDGSQLAWIDKNYPDLVSRDLCVLAVNAYGLAIRNVPSDFMTEEIAKVAVERDGRAFYYLPKEFQTRELIMKIGIKNLPDEMKTYEHCLDECTKQGRMLKYVPIRLMDEQIIEAALQRNPWALEFVPTPFRALACVVRLLKQEPNLPQLLQLQAG